MTLQDLLKLIYYNDIPELIKQKNDGVDFTILDTQNGNNILIAYAGYGYDEKYTPSEMISFLLECGLDINHQQNKRGSMLSALHMAAGNDLIEIVRLLIANGANIEARDKNGNTPIWNMISYYDGDENELEIIQLLISEGASLKTNNDHSNSPISMIYDQHLRICEGNASKESDLFFLLNEEEQKGLSGHIATLADVQILGDYYSDEFKRRLEKE